MPPVRVWFEKWKVSLGMGRVVRFPSPNPTFLRQDLSEVTCLPIFEIKQQGGDINLGPGLRPVGKRLIPSNGLNLTVGARPFELEKQSGLLGQTSDPRYSEQELRNSALAAKLVSKFTRPRIRLETRLRGCSLCLCCRGSITCVTSGQSTIRQRARQALAISSGQQP